MSPDKLLNFTDLADTKLSTFQPKVAESSYHPPDRRAAGHPGNCINRFFLGSRLTAPILNAVPLAPLAAGTSHPERQAAIGGSTRSLTPPGAVVHPVPQHQRGKAGSLARYSTAGVRLKQEIFRECKAAAVQ